MVLIKNDNHLWADVISMIQGYTMHVTNNDLVICIAIDHNNIGYIYASPNSEDPTIKDIINETLYYGTKISYTTAKKLIKEQHGIWIEQKHSKRLLNWIKRLLH